MRATRPLLALLLTATALVLLPEVAALASNKTALRLADKVNEEGPWLGLVVPNIYELSPLLAPGVFVPHPSIPLLDLAGEPPISTEPSHHSTPNAVVLKQPSRASAPDAMCGCI